MRLVRVFRTFRIIKELDGVSRESSEECRLKSSSLLYLEGMSDNESLASEAKYSG